MKDKKLRLTFIIHHSSFIICFTVADYFVEGGSFDARDLLGRGNFFDADAEDVPAPWEGDFVGGANGARRARGRVVDRDRAGIAQLLRGE